MMRLTGLFRFDGLSRVIFVSHFLCGSPLQAVIIKAIIQRELGLPIVEISDQKATIDGGDVLFTGDRLREIWVIGIFICLLHVIAGKEFFVGISERTNLGGARAVAAAFPEFPCTPIRVTISPETPPSTHLTNVLFHIG